MCLLNPEARTRRSRAFLALGMIFLSLAVVWPVMIPARALAPNLSDFFKGMLYGLSFAFNIGSIALQRRPPRNTPAS